jgi:hypothetical protein
LGGRFRAGSGHAEQHSMQQRHIAPFTPPPTQRRAGGAAGTGEKFTPLDTFAQKEL